jgi:hypothetical protein
MNRRDLLSAGAAGLAAGLVPGRLGGAEPPGGDLLYKGIRLPSPWPPRITEVPRDPVTPPYVAAPPAVIPIDVGRQLTVEVLDERGRALDGLGRADCVPDRADRTLQAVTWKRPTLAAAAGKPVKFRFHLKDGRLHAFWVSPVPSGASHGYVAAGGPGFTGPTDTVATP